MKRLLSILFLLIFSLSITDSQPKVTSYVDSVKNVNVNINADSRQRLLLEDLQGELINIQNNQAAVNTSMFSTIAEIISEVNNTSKEIEERNKSDGKLITDVFNYTPERIKQVIRKERWLNFTIALLCIVYILSVTTQMNVKHNQMELLSLRLLFYTVYGVSIFIALHSLLTLLFNGDYYVIKELMKLYT